MRDFKGSIPSASTRASSLTHLERELVYSNLRPSAALETPMWTTLRPIIWKKLIHAKHTFRSNNSIFIEKKSLFFLHRQQALQIPRIK